VISDVIKKEVSDMKFIKPKIIKGQKVDWLISERTRAIMRYYAQYTGYNESEIANEFLVNILDDPEFGMWIQNKRDNKRILSKVYGEQE
jgi:hypothetical protein